MLSSNIIFLTYITRVQLDLPWYCTSPNTAYETVLRPVCKNRGTTVYLKERGSIYSHQPTFLITWSTKQKRSYNKHPEAWEKNIICAKFLDDWTIKWNSFELYAVLHLFPPELTEVESVVYVQNRTVCRLACRQGQEMVTWQKFWKTLLKHSTCSFSPFLSHPCDKVHAEL